MDVGPFRVWWSENYTQVGIEYRRDNEGEPDWPIVVVDDFYADAADGGAPGDLHPATVYLHRQGQEEPDVIHFNPPADG
jgi:hypothetical protein